MAVTSRSVLKTWFQTGKKPTQGQFAAWIDSFIHATDDPIAINKINGLQGALSGKASSVSVAALQSELDELEEIVANLTDAKSCIVVESDEVIVINWQTDLVPQGLKSYASKHGNAGINVTGTWYDEGIYRNYIPNFEITKDDDLITTVKITDIQPGTIIII